MLNDDLSKALAKWISGVTGRETVFKSEKGIGPRPSRPFAELMATGTDDDAPLGTRQGPPSALDLIVAANEEDSIDGKNTREHAQSEG